MKLRLREESEENAAIHKDNETSPSFIHCISHSATRISGGKEFYRSRGRIGARRAPNSNERDKETASG